MAKPGLHGGINLARIFLTGWQPEVNRPDFSLGYLPTMILEM